MMQSLRQWVAQLAAIGLVLAFSEAILPRGDLRRFARVVVGLVVVAVVLGSFVDLSRLSDALAVPSLAVGAPPGHDGWPASYVEMGKGVLEAGMGVAAGELGERVARQVESLARLSSGVDDARARVALGPSGRVERIDVVIRPASTQDQYRGLRDSEEARASAEAHQALAARVEWAIRDYCGLGPDTEVAVEVRP